jgi:hypothetical protein
MRLVCSKHALEDVGRSIFGSGDISLRWISGSIARSVNPYDAFLFFVRDLFRDNLVNLAWRHVQIDIYKYFFRPIKNIIIEFVLAKLK